MKTLRTPEDILSKMMDEEFPAEPEVKPYIMAEVKPYIFKLARIAQKEAWNAAVRAAVDLYIEDGNPKNWKDSILTLIEE